jgi:hypothetical protein
MTIDICRPELEALIRNRMASGGFASVEELLMDALDRTAVPTVEAPATRRTGADLVAAMQACPIPDFEFGIERTPIRIRDVEI